MDKYKLWLQEEQLEQIRRWREQGLGGEEIAGRMGVHPKTLREWRKRYPGIARAMLQQPDVEEDRLEQAILRCAVGYEYIDEEVANRREVRYLEGKRVSEVSEPVVLQVHRHRPGDVRAQQLWLETFGKRSGGLLEEARRLLEGVGDGA